MKYVEMTVEEALKFLNTKDKILVAVEDLEEDANIIFIKKTKEYSELFDDIKTTISIHDEFIKQLVLFTEKQNIYNIKPIGKRKTVLFQ